MDFATNQKKNIPSLCSINLNKNNYMLCKSLLSLINQRKGGHGTDEELQEGVLVASNIKFEEARDENHRAGARPISTKKKTSREGCKGGALLESTLRVEHFQGF